MKLRILFIALVFISMEVGYAQSYNEVLWQKKNGPSGGAIQDIEYDPGSGKVFAIAGQNRRKLFISSDNGDSWTEKTGANNFNYFNDIEIVNNTIYLTTSYDVWSSVDGGANFTQITTDFYDFGNANRIKRLSSGRLIVLGNSGVFYSITNGASWSPGYAPMSGSLDGSWLVNNSSDQLFVIKDNRPYRSVNQGVDFTEFSTGIPIGETVHSLAVNNAGSLVYCVTGSNIYQSDGTGSWTSIKYATVMTDATISDFSNEKSFLEFSADGLGMYFIDNVNQKLYAKTVSGATSTWTLRQSSFPTASLDVRVASSKDFPTVATSTTFFGTPSGVYKTTSGGATFVESNTGIPGISPQELLIDANNNLYLFTWSNEIIRSTDGGNNWSKLTGITSSIYDFAQNATRNVLYAATTTGPFRSTNNGTNWTAIPLPGGLITYNLFAPDQDKLFALYNNNSFYYSSNQGASWTATPITITGFPASFSASSDNIAFASPNLAMLKLYDYGTSSYKIYKIVITYTGANAVSTAVASEITNAPILVNDINQISGANGKIYLIDPYGSPDQLAVTADGGANWTLRNIGSISNAYVAYNGYVFTTESATKKVNISRDDGATFQATTMSASTQVGDIEDVEIASSYPYDGIAFIAFDGDFIHASAKTIVTPNAPSNVTFLGRSATAIALGWDDNSSNEERFEILRSSDGINFTNIGSAYDNCNTPNARAFYTATSLQANTSYTFRVFAKNEAGTSGYASLVQSTSATCSPTIPDNRSWSAVNAGSSGFAIVTPKIVGISHLGGGRYQISDISLGTLSGSPFFSSSDLATFYECGGQTFVVGSNDDDIKPNGAGTWNGTNTLTLKWRACDGDEFETITLTLQSSDPAPVAPANPHAYNLTNSSIEVNWTSGYYQKTYVVERSTTSGSGFTQVGSDVLYPATKLIDSGPLTPGTTYYYRIKAKNANTPTPGESPYSSEVSVQFQSPKFLLSNNVLSNTIAATVGSYWADFNNDGNQDYMTLSFDPVAERGTPLIFQNTGSNFTLMTPALDPEPYFMAALGDYNNDGKIDLLLNGTETSVNDLYKGNGDFTFTKQTSGLGDLASFSAENVDTQSSSWGDINNDGLLDLMILGDDNSGNGKILLYRQNSNNSFSKITGGTDMAADILRASSASWADYNNDGRMDVVITNTNGAFRLYENNGNETFTKKTLNGLDASGGFSATWGDYNNDGFLDLFAGVFTLNALYKNNGDGTFTKDISTSVSEAAQTIGSAWGDFNNDGYLDLIVSGFGTTQTRLYLRDASNPSNVVFTKIINEKINDLNVSHYGTSVVDYNQNGFLDIGMSSFLFGTADEIGVTNTGLFDNNIMTGNWSEIKLNPTSGNEEGVGATVRLTAGGITQTRHFPTSTAMVSRSSTLAHFGIGSASTITNIQVKWANGDIQNYPNPPINQILTIPQDNQGPLILSHVPAHTATNVNATTTITINVNDATSTAVASKNLTLTPATGTPVVIAVTAGVKTGTQFVFTIPKLLRNTVYAVSLDAGAFADIYGNTSAAIASTSWTFTTDPGPSATLLPTHSAVDVALNAALEITFNKQVNFVATKKIKVMDGTTAVIDLDVSTNGTLASNKYTLPAPAGNWPSLKDLKVTVDAGAFVDQNGNEFAGIALDSWNFRTVEPPDVTPPVISFTAITTPDKGFGTGTPSIGTVTDNKAVTSVVVSIRKISGTTYTQVNATPGAANGYTVALSEASHFDETGAEFFITATDAAGNSTREPAGTATHKVYLKYNAAQSAIPTNRLGFGGQKTNWKVIAIPFELASPANSVSAVFNELDGLDSKKDYRIITYGTPTAWSEYPSGFSTISRGVGYFINIKTDPGVIGLFNNLQPAPNSRGNLYQITLKPGWNMVGNPYLSAISWADVATLNSLTGTTAQLKKFSTGTYTNNQSLDSYEGGFVFSALTSDKTVDIPFLGQTASGGRKGFHELGSDISAEAWALPMKINQGGFSYDLSAIGMTPEANTSLDDYDDVTPPRFFDYLEMNFSHPEHFAKRFTRDIVQTQQNYTWEFTVDTNIQGYAELTWDNTPISGSTKDLFLMDISGNRLINMKEIGSYLFDPKVSSNFRIYFGENLKIAPEQVHLGNAWPNPTNGYTTIAFSLPETGGLNQLVKVDILDAMGREVGKITEGRYNPGFYETSFDAKEFNNGFYTYRLTVQGIKGSTTQVNKLIIK